jgi:hypothetical protein
MAKQSRASWPGAGAGRYARNHEAQGRDRFQTRDTSDQNDSLLTGRSRRRKARTAIKPAATAILGSVERQDRPTVMASVVKQSKAP